MQEYQFPIAIHAPEFLRGIQQPPGHPVQGLLSFSPPFYVVRYPLDGRETRFDWIRRGPRSEQHGAHAQPMHRKHFLEPFFSSSVASKYVSKRRYYAVLASAEASVCLSMPNLARLVPRLLARVHSIARSKVSTSSEVRSCPGAALANVNEVMAAKRHVLIECPPIIGPLSSFAGSFSSHGRWLAMPRLI